MRVLKVQDQIMEDGVRALVVGVGASFRALLASCFSGMGVTVLECENAESARACLEQDREFALIVAQQDLPDMRGTALCGTVRGVLELTEIPFLLCADVPGEGRIQDLFSDGVTDVLALPSPPAVLSARISPYVDVYRMKETLAATERQLEERVLEATREVAEKNVLLSQRLEELGVLNAASLGLSNVHDLRELFAHILRLSQEVMHAEASSVYDFDQETRCLRLYVAEGEAKAHLESSQLEIGQGIAGWVAEHRRALVLEDAYTDPRFDASFDQRSGFRTRALICVPLILEERLLGVLQVLNKSDGLAFDEHDQQMFLSFANIASFAIFNAYRFEEISAITDELREALEAERRLSSQKERMGAYLPRNVLEQISSDADRALPLGGRLVEATVLFADIRGFTAISERLSATTVIDVLNEYMDRMTNAILDGGGVVDKFIGDGIMALFLEDDRFERNAARRAIEVGVEMQRRARALAADWSESRPEVGDFVIRVGINTGQVVAGNIGTGTRRDYTVVGDGGNVASRLETSAAGGQILVSEATFVAAGQPAATALEPLQVRNRVEPVAVYAVHSD